METTRDEPRDLRGMLPRMGVMLLIVLIGRSPGEAEQRPPNVLIVMADDLGFSDLGCYGSEISTPVLDSLAMSGTVFSNFHAASTCSPTRAMLLTGVDHHLAGLGNMYEFLSSAPSQAGRPGYEGHLNDSVVTMAEVLKGVGYHTAISGKWHLGQQLVVSHAPVARGFDQSWVLWHGWAEHYFPEPRRPFVEGDMRVPYPAGRYSTEWYTDKAIEFADEAIDHQRPFFLFASYTAPHWPLEAPAELIARQKGKYDDGYDRIRERRTSGLIGKRMLREGTQEAIVPARRPQLHHEFPLEQTKSWQELSPAERAYSARLMEVHAAMIEALDQQVGRLFMHLKRRGAFDNTFILFLSDNGAAPLSTSATQPGNELENVGRPGSFVGFGPEWARASSGPLRLMKGYTTEGGTRVPAIVKLPQRNESRLSGEFATVLDVAPTIYELTGAAYPQTFRQRELHALNGVSMLPYLRGQSDYIHRDDDATGWELFGRAALRRGRWKITWIEKPFGASAFELFDIEADPGETKDVRRLHPDIYQQMLEAFAEYAREKGVVIERPGHWEP